MTGAIKCAFFGHMDYCIISFRTEAEIIFQWSRFLFVDGELQSSNQYSDEYRPYLNFQQTMTTEISYVLQKVRRWTNVTEMSKMLH